MPIIYLTILEKKEVCYTPAEEDDIIRQNNDGVVEINDDDDDSHEVPKNSTRKAVEMLNLFEFFWLQQESDHNNFLGQFKR